MTFKSFLGRLTSTGNYFIVLWKDVCSPFLHLIICDNGGTALPSLDRGNGKCETRTLGHELCCHWEIQG